MQLLKTHCNRNNYVDLGMYREWKEIEFSKEYHILIWEQKGGEVDQEIDGEMKLRRKEGRMVGEKWWQGKVYDREEWKTFLRMARNCNILHMPKELMNVC